MDATLREDRMQRIYRAHSRALMNELLGWTCGDWQAAEDLLQETMMRAWRNLETLNPDPLVLRPWLRTVARRAAIDRYRFRSARPQETELDALERYGEPREPFEEQLLEQQAVWELLRGLSEAHRSVLCHVYLLDQTVPQAAMDLGVPVGTVKSRLHHALHMVRAAAKAETDGAAGRDQAAKTPVYA
jgi:RNA polymerase sigma-70 factor (ECF subfamily)